MTDDGNYEFDYDSENQLVSIYQDDIPAAINYEYDNLGRRISKTTGGVTTEYVYDGDQVIAEYDDSVTQGTFVLVRKFIYGPGIDEPIMMIDVAGGGGVSVQRRYTRKDIWMRR